MEFLDRKEELAELRRVLSRHTPSRFVVVFGRRRLGKSTLIKKVLESDDIYYMAGDFVDTVQRDMLKSQLAEKFPEIALANYSSWEDLLKMLNTLTTSQFTLCLDEFPYMVKHSPELPSIIQRLVDTKSLKFNLVICGSSQRMMQNMVLSQSEPLYGRANALTNPEIATELHKKIVEKASSLPFAKDKEIVPVLFLKSKPKDTDFSKGMNILYPEDVVQMTYGEG